MCVPNIPCENKINIYLFVTVQILRRKYYSSIYLYKSQVTIFGMNRLV